MKKYLVCMEIAGATAMWTRPDTGDSPVSYLAPTYSAVKGIFESVLWGPTVLVRPIKVEICAPLVYHSYQTNYGGPLRKSGVIKTGGGFQLLATVLIDVCYRLYAEVEAADHNKQYMSEKTKEWNRKTTSPGHAYKAIFERRLAHGQFYIMPSLGWREFVPSYFGPFREFTKVQFSINSVIPSMLREVFPGGYHSNVHVQYDRNVQIVNGVLDFSKSGGCHDQ